VDASGRLGLGTSSPSEKLHVSGGNVLLQQGNYFIIPDGGGAYGAGNGSYIGNSGQNLQIQMRNSGDGVISFGIGASERMRLDTNGRLGIGTTSPGSVFHARLPGTSTATIATFDRSDGAVSSEIHYDGTDGRITFGTTTNHPLSFKTNNTRAVTIDSSQRVGIGTTSPNGPLEVIGTAATIAARATTAVSSLAIQIYNNGTDSYIDSTAYGAGSGGGIVFRRNGTGEMGRFDTSGRLLVGTSSKTATASTTAKGIIGLGGGGAMICAEGQIANNGTIDITVSTGGLHYFTGLLQVNNINAASGGTNTQSLISVLGNTQSGIITTSTLHTANGGAGQAFTITYVATGILRFTNTSGSTCNVHINYMGGGINAS
jgi:hypothetical protein